MVDGVEDTCFLQFLYCGVMGWHFREDEVCDSPCWGYVGAGVFVGENVIERSWFEVVLGDPAADCDSFCVFMYVVTECCL